MVAQFTQQFKSTSVVSKSQQLREIGASDAKSGRWQSELITSEDYCQAYAEAWYELYQENKAEGLPTIAPVNLGYIMGNCDFDSDPASEDNPDYVWSDRYGEQFMLGKMAYQLRHQSAEVNPDWF